MPKKISNTTKAHLTSVPLPQHGASYTVISHQFVMDYAVQQLQTAGFIISDEEYRCTADGQIAQGIYRLNYNNDPELSMMFAWTNSYNKQVKFKCVVGAYINNTGSVMVSGDIGNWVRKHTGTADTETKDTIDDYIKNAHMYYNQLVSDKKCMEGIDLNRRKQSQLLGVLFAEYEILTTEQASMVRDQMKKPQHVFASSDSLWAFYNYVTVALQKSHPRTWMEDQRILHFFISTIGNFQQINQQPVQPVQSTNEDTEDEVVEVDPNQVTIMDEIESREAESASLPLDESTGDQDEIEDSQDVVDNNSEVTIEDQRAEYWADAEMQEMKTEQVIEEREEEDENPVYDEDQIAERIREDEAAVAEVCDEEESKDEFAAADDFALDFNEETNESQDNVPDFF